MTATLRPPRPVDPMSMHEYQDRHANRRRDALHMRMFTGVPFAITGLSRRTRVLIEETRTAMRELLKNIMSNRADHVPYIDICVPRDESNARRTPCISNYLFYSLTEAEAQKVRFVVWYIEGE